MTNNKNIFSVNGTEIKKEEKEAINISISFFRSDKDCIKAINTIKKIFKEQITHSETRKGTTRISIEITETVVDFFRAIYYHVFAKINRNYYCYLNCDILINYSAIYRISVNKDIICIDTKDKNNDHGGTCYCYDFTEIERILKAIKDLEDGNCKTTITQAFIKIEETKQETPVNTDKQETPVNTDKQIALITEFIEFARQKIKEAREIGAEDLVYKFLIEIKRLKQMIIEIKAKTGNKVIYLNYKNQLLLNYSDDNTRKEIARVKNKIETTKNKIETIKKENEILESYKNFIESKERKIKRTFTDKNYIDYLAKSKYFREEIWDNNYHKIPIIEGEIIKLEDYKKQLIN